MARPKSDFGPNLANVLEGAPAALVREFLASFRRPDKKLLSPPDIPVALPERNGKARLAEFLRSEDREILGLVEGICGVLLDMGRDKGATSLDTVAAERLQNVDHDTYEAQPDSLCKSIWTRTRFPGVFRDAESFYAARRYRERLPYYTCCEVDFDKVPVVNLTCIPEERLCTELQDALGLKAKVTASILELPGTANHPPSFMVALRHPGPLSSIEDHREEGGWTVHYYRPSHEAVLIYTPGLKKIEVASASFEVRDKTSRIFAEVVLGRPRSSKPLTRREFNLVRFRTSFHLDCPAFSDVEVTTAKVVEAEMRLGNWARRLNVKAALPYDLEEVFREYLTNASKLIRLFGFTKIAVAIGYKRRSGARTGTFRITVSDGSSSDVQSQRDPFLRDLGFRLLTHWGITQELHPLTEEEKASWFRFLLSLYDLPGDTVSGPFFTSAGVDPARLITARLIARKGRQVVGLADGDGDGEVVEVDQETGPELGTVREFGGFGETRGVRPDTDQTEYVIDRKWLTETVLKATSRSLGSRSIEIVDDLLVSLGDLPFGQQNVPLYVARRLGDGKARDRLDLTLRTRHTSGPGLVLATSDEPPRYLGPNVVIALHALLRPDGALGELDPADLARQFEANRSLVANALVAQVRRHSHQSGTLIIPGLDPLPLEGPKQTLLFERLVLAAKDGSGQRLTKVLMEGMGSDNPRQLFSKMTWAKVYPKYIVHGTSNRFWRLGEGPAPQ